MLSRLAPAPDREELHYNNFQFSEQKSNRVASQSSGLSFDDRDGMYRQNGVKPRASKWIPAWSQNASALRLVIMLRLFSYGRHGWGTRTNSLDLPPNADYVEIADMADEYFSRSISRRRLKRTASPTQKLIFENHINAVERAGGYAALVAAIAYRSLRLGWNSTQVADTLGVTPTMVRQQIWRLRQIARALKLEYDETRHWTNGVPLTKRRIRLLKQRMKSKE